MAELIPLDYRLRVLTRRRLERWCVWGALVVAVCAAAFFSTYALELRRERELAGLKAEQCSRAGLIARSQEVVATRQDLADRLAKIQRLRDDQVLQTLLFEIANAKAENDRLETIRMDTGVGRTAPQTLADGSLVIARVSGITQNSATLAELMRRLSQSARKPVEIRLENSHSDTCYNGNVMRMQLVWARPGTPKS